MAKQDEAKLAKLIRKNMAKAEARQNPKDKRRAQYDPTLRVADMDEDPDRKAFFSEMKKREF